MTRYATTDGESPKPLPARSAHERALLRYVAGLAEAMGLRDWQVEAQRADVGDHAVAHAEITYGRKVLTVSLGPRFFEETPAEQRATAAHELLHAHMDGPATAVCDIETQLGTLQWEMLNETFRRRLEEATDAIACAVAPYLPMPPRPKRAKRRARR